MGSQSMTSLIPRVPRNAALLIALLVLIVVAPLIPMERYWFLVELIFDAILLAGVYSVGPGKNRWPFLILTVVTFGTRWGETFSGQWALDVGALAITVVWLVYAVSIIVAHLFRSRDVTVDTIMGAVVPYLMVAIAFAISFEIIELHHPGSFSGLPENALHDRSELGNAMIYFSLVCITTMGYGDIVPVSTIARPFVVMEGVFGQLYLAVMIARLVGLHLVSERQADD
jgi:hypothetical protein